jgi:DNA polymerase III subunit gamma/tau
MGYQVLARKWRPHSFHEVVGQQHVLTALINALDQGRLHHAYLLSGTRGVGKTTIARILAKCLNCEQGVSSTPCGQCDSCREIDQGNFVDLLEIDAASRTKVEDTRELLDNVQYRPARGRYKVYLIDEVHMLSRHSFNALLKTLEEPPPYVKFLLATTDPQKLPITILSRCLQFHLKALNREQIVSQLVRVLDAEAQPYELPALAALAKAADGSMRDALSLTDQALAHGSGHVHLDQVLAMLGTLDHRHLHHILQLLAQLQGPALMAKVNEVAQLGPDFELLHAELASLLHRIALAQLLGGSADPLALDSDQVVALANTFTAEEIQLYYQIALTGRRELPLAPDGRSGFEMTLLRMLAFSPRKSVDVAHLAASPALAPVERASVVVPSAPAVKPVSTDPYPSERMRAHDQPSTIATPMAPAAADYDYAPATAEEDSATLAAQEALFAEQQRLVDEAASWQGVPEAVGAPEPAVSQSQPMTPSQSGSGLSQLLQVRNRLRSQQKEGASDAQSSPSAPRAQSRYQPPTASAVPAVTPQEMPLSRPAAPPSSRPAPTAELPASGGKSVGLMDDLPPWETPPLASYQERGGDMATAIASEPFSPEPFSPELLPPDPQPWQPAGPFSESGNGAVSEIETAVVPPSRPVNAAKPMESPTASVEQSEPQDARWLSNDLLIGCGDEWAELIASCGLGGRLRQLALQASRDVAGNEWLLTLPAEHRHLVSDKALAALMEGFSRHLAHPVQIRIELGAPTQLTPIQIEHQRYAQLLVEAQQNLAQDPHIQFLIQRFGAQLDADSIQPLKH